MWPVELAGRGAAGAICSSHFDGALAEPLPEASLSAKTSDQVARKVDRKPSRSCSTEDQVAISCLIILVRNLQLI
jgi:hypothetical protein